MNASPEVLIFLRGMDFSGLERRIKATLLLDEPPFYGHRGPRVEHDVTLAAFPPTEEPEPSPREVAKARALAVFGPKRGRWA